MADDNLEARLLRHVMDARLPASAGAPVPSAPHVRHRGARHVADAEPVRAGPRDGHFDRDDRRALRPPGAELARLDPGMAEHADGSFWRLSGAWRAGPTPTSRRFWLWERDYTRSGRRVSNPRPSAW